MYDKEGNNDLKLIPEDGEDNFEPSEMNDLIGNVREAKFILKNPKEFVGKTFFCGNDDYESANNVTIKASEEYFTNEWTEWSKEKIQEFFSRFYLNKC